MTQHNTDTVDWWDSLTHGGMLIAPARIAEYFPERAEPLPAYLSDRLRRDLLRAATGDGSHLTALLDIVLEEVVGLKPSWWTKGSEVDARWSHKALTGEIVKPRRVWHALPSEGPEGQPAGGAFVLPLFVADAGTAHGGDVARLGVGRGRRPVSRVIEWLRRSGLPVALLTNGRQWRLIHAGADYDAWCEWDTELWFEQGVPGPQINALRTLLAPAALTAKQPAERPPLVAAILDSRRGQAELSSALGERVRLAVEKLIQESGDSIAHVAGDGSVQVSPRELYIAATRIVMRCVVVLFAEARELLPRFSPVYHGCYGIQGLREQLARRAGGRAERLRHSHGAWPRLLALFELIRLGSAHPELQIHEYGGGLFVPGDRKSKDGVLRALAAFEDPANVLSDYCIHQILELLTVSMVKVRQGRSSTWVNTPVDFSDLSTEYIGILYEGLLDFELRRAPNDDAIVFLRLGDEPALPLSRLEEEMAPQRLKELIGKLKKSTKKLVVAEGDGDEDEEDEEEDASEDAGEDETTAAAIAEHEVADNDTDAPSRPMQEAGSIDIVRNVRERASIWAEKAVKEARLVAYPRNDADPVVRERWNQEVRDKAEKLYRLVLPGQWYLVRWGGTRKGAGTFYTRPQLAVPTVRRTLEPLCYATDKEGGLTSGPQRKPRTPEEILKLKVCDPAMGSGSFLVSTLRYITDALVESLHANGRLHARPDGAIVKLADGLPLEHPSQETLPVPLDDPDFDDRLRARLKRHVVERCIYGVDLDPLAVELARMALWIETMDPRLPFGFLDHKLRCGNALVGTWFDRFQDYPVMAFARDDAGDKNHERFVHHFRMKVLTRGARRGQAEPSGDKWTHSWKETKDDVIKPAMREWIDVRGPQRLLALMEEGVSPERVHDEELAVFQALHDLPVHEVAERERLYRECIAENPAIQRLRTAFDTWCAIWFWPGDALGSVPKPSELTDPSLAAREIVERLREEHRFFHWELEFPDVFTEQGAGFDAIVGNPPWEIQKPNSKEFFSNIDPLYRTYGKQEALQAQKTHFERNAAVEHNWLAYVARFKSFSTWNKFAAFPFGDPSDVDEKFSFSRSASENARFHDIWRSYRAGRTGYSDTEHPFRHQGSADINTYKMFVEAGRVLLRNDGYLGFVTPSGIYTDKGSTDLRKLLLDRNRWEWLFGFENRQGIFDIHRSFKFNPIIVRKGGQTAAIHTAFMHRDVEDWQDAERYALAYPRERVTQLSPHTSALIEFRSSNDVRLFTKILSCSAFFQDFLESELGTSLLTEVHKTNDSALFLNQQTVRERGESRSINLREVTTLERLTSADRFPVYEGKTIHQFDCAWEEPKIFMARSGIAEWYRKKGKRRRDVTIEQYFRPRIVFREVARSTDERSVIATYLPAASLTTYTLRAIDLVRDCPWFLLAILNSFVFDFVTRLRGNLHLSTCYNELPILQNDLWRDDKRFTVAVAQLALNGSAFAREWLGLRTSVPSDRSWHQLWAITPAERLRLRAMLDALVAFLYELHAEEFASILVDCDHPRSSTANSDFTQSLDARAFWRVHKDFDPELRLTVLAQIAFRDLQRLGLEGFLNQHNGEGWMIPETVRLADYGLGRDDRAKEHQPVASRLGPRFLPWQLEQGVEESWEECVRHAEKIEALLGGRALGVSAVREPAPSQYVAGPSDLFGKPVATDLFGEPSPPAKRRRR